MQRLIKFIVEDYVFSLKYPIGITDDAALRNKKLSPELDKVRRNIEIFYDSYSIVPDADIIIYDKTNYKIIAVLSCKGGKLVPVKTGSGYPDVGLIVDSRWSGPRRFPLSRE